MIIYGPLEGHNLQQKIKYSLQGFCSIDLMQQHQATNLASYMLGITVQKVATETNTHTQNNKLGNHNKTHGHFSF